MDARCISIDNHADALCSAAYECPVRAAGRLLCGDAVIF